MRKKAVKIVSSSHESILNTLLILTFFTILLYIPVFRDPSILLGRGNDLETFFWPLYHYVKDSILTYKEIPLINNMYFAGTPLISDPQTPFFYFPNIIFLLLPINAGFIISFICHTLFSGIACYLLSSNGIGLSKRSSIIASILYMTSPKFSGYLEAGHVGLIYSWAWIPLVYLFFLKILKKADLKFTILFSYSLSSVFFTHLVTFILVTMSLIILFFIICKLSNKYNIKYGLLSLSLGFILTFGIISVSLLPQVDWANVSTRQLLINDKDTYPKWNSYKEFLVNVINPLILNLRPDTEKIIPIGIFASLMLLLVLIKGSKLQKFMLITIVIFLVLLALNTKSPIYPLMAKFDYYYLMRVTTRFWFIMVIFLSIFLPFMGEKMGKLKPLYYFLLSLVLVEQIITSWWILSKPFTTQDRTTEQNIINYLKSTGTKEIRLMCTNRCISAKTAAINDVELIEGYNTVAQINFYKEAWQLTGKYWNYYSLSIPPFGTYLNEKLNPDPKDLGEFNVKFLISPYELSNSNFVFIKKIDKFFIYQNSLYRSRFAGTNFEELKSTKHSQNEYLIDLNTLTIPKVFTSFVYNKNWKGFDELNNSMVPQERPNSLILIESSNKTRYLRLKYDPEAYRLGLLITWATLLPTIFYLIISQTKLNIPINQIVNYFRSFLIKI